MTDVRRHGLQWPWTAHLIGGVIGVAYTIAAFIFVLKPSNIDHIVFFSIFSLGLIAFLVTVLIDPRVVPNPAPADGNRFCNTCELSMNPRTKHCRICNKCIHRFDHHCLYLNTCIGGRNYRPFFVLVTLTVAWLSMYLSVAIITFIDRVKYSNARDDIFGSSVVYLSVLGCISLIPLFMFFAILSLWMFHIYIGFLRVSTYDWIIGKRTSDDSIEMPAQLSERRQDEIQARRQEIYEQWVRQNRLRQKQQQELQNQQQQQQQQQNPQQSATGAEADASSRHDIVLDVSNPDLKIEVVGHQLPRMNSESILSQVEEVLGIDIQVNEGQERPDRNRQSRPASLNRSSSNQDDVR